MVSCEKVGEKKKTKSPSTVSRSLLVFSVMCVWAMLALAVRCRHATPAFLPFYDTPTRLYTTQPPSSFSCRRRLAFPVKALRQGPVQLLAPPRHERLCAMWCGRGHAWGQSVSQSAARPARPHPPPHNASLLWRGSGLHDRTHTHTHTHTTPTTPTTHLCDGGDLAAKLGLLLGVALDGLGHGHQVHARVEEAQARDDLIGWKH